MMRNRSFIRLGANVNVVIMAKSPMLGRVKTRLIGALSPQQAADVHSAMLDCVLSRVADAITRDPRPSYQLAFDTDRHSGDAISFHVSSPWQLVDQGTGDLGARITNVWDRIGGGPAVFLGVDSPDIPSKMLQSVLPALDTHDVVIGPVEDGGYWTLASRQLQPALLRGIDWGTDRVYHQTQFAARQAKLRLATLPTWYDVDESSDLAKLQERISSAVEPPLVQLRRRLENTLKGDTP